LNDAVGGGKFRLPAAAEWEYAARGGSVVQPTDWWYAGSSTIDSVAWYLDNSGDITHEVVKKAANGINAYDMSGNVNEWCEDSFNSGLNSLRVTHSGGWDNSAGSCNVASSRNEMPSYRSGDLGFRLACSAQ
jgi:formylglycine-generating enzyme required for sulfatase activity